MLFLYACKHACTYTHARGVAGLPTVEFITAFSHAGLDIPEKKKLHSDGTNRDPVLGTFEKPDWTSDELFKVGGRNIALFVVSSFFEGNLFFIFVHICVFDGN